MRAFKPIVIPCFATEEYDGGDIMSYPKRQGYCVGRGKKSISFMQTWLYFGLLSEFLGRCVKIAEYSRFEEDGSRVMSTASLLLDIDVWKSQHIAIEEKEDHDYLQRWSKVALKIAELLSLLKSKDLNWDLLLGLPLTTLIETFDTALRTVYGKRITISLPRTLHISELMLKDSWCPYSVFACHERFKIAAQYLIYTVGRPQDGRCHKKCSKQECHSNQVSMDEYDVRHVDGCDGCN